MSSQSSLRRLETAIVVEESAGIDRLTEPISCGIPLPEGAVSDASALTLAEDDGSITPLQVEVLDRWRDGTCRWVLLDFQTTIPALRRKEYLLRVDAQTGPRERIILGACGENLEVCTGSSVFRLGRQGPFPFNEVLVDGEQILATTSPGMLMTNSSGRICDTATHEIRIETRGPLRSTIYVAGVFSERRGREPVAKFFSRLHFFLGRSLVRMDLTVRNPRAAKHRGGLWDLGDPGSIFFEDLSLHLRIAGSARACSYWATERNAVLTPTQDEPLEIYQDSSGGENWRSRNHLNHRGQVMNSFRGYRVRLGDDDAVQGGRAEPTVMLSTDRRCISASIENFWQNFPKAIEANHKDLVLRLFPRQYADVFELQGGEQKTHTVYLEFAKRCDRSRPMFWINTPLLARVPPQWYARCKVFPYVLPESKDSNRAYLNLVHSALEGDRSLFARREVIDEYGWRHFGELYADHEAAYYSGPKPIISHYNNQYDGVQAFGLHYIRSGDARWFLLMRDLTRHVIDIDIYHTLNDRPAYSGGFFWHTDHYSDAATSTHRGFSRYTKEQRKLRDYGGGPCNEHLYTTGLMTYYFLTGDPQARGAVLDLADWVLRMDDGALTPLRFLERKPTGLASQTGDRDYHGPGRGAGNSINGLLDAYRLSRKRKYLAKAEELVRRCIHPEDAIESMNLADVERRWSYLVFLQALGKYLDCKVEWREPDEMFHYARESLLHYARWMAEHEVPYSEVLDRVEFPTETWIVQDLRKSDVLGYAAKYSPRRAEQDQFISKGRFFFSRCLQDLEKFPTKTCTRPLVLLLHYGCMRPSGRSGELPVTCFDSGRKFGRPKIFKRQGRLVDKTLRALKGWRQGL